jgi:site-specific DNA-methyltransferase (adenine-specific)
MSEVVKIGDATLYHGDCMDYMAGLPDKIFELAIVDPPYGIGINMNQGRRKGELVKHARKRWDECAPEIEYWIELCRVSKNRIVWGANNFSWVPAHNGWIIWDKDITGNVMFSRAELAYCSILNTVQMVKIRAQTGPETYTNKIHPTQKPIALYEWLLTNYAKQGDRILDTHLGSGSSAIAANGLGFEFVGIELDADYYAAACERIARAAAQPRLFTEPPPTPPKQESMVLHG